MRSSPSPSAWDEAYHTRQPLQRSLWLAASSSSWASPDCGHWWFASSRKVSRRVSCQWWGKRMEKRVFFFEVVWGCADFFSAISAIQTSYRPNFWWPTGEPRYWCWCWPLSVLHRIPKLRRHLFNNFNRCTWGFLRTWTEWSHKPNTVIIFRWSKGVAKSMTAAVWSCLKLKAWVFPLQILQLWWPWTHWAPATTTRPSHLDWPLPWASLVNTMNTQWKPVAFWISLNYSESFWIHIARKLFLLFRHVPTSLLVSRLWLSIAVLCVTATLLGRTLGGLQQEAGAIWSGQFTDLSLLIDS